MVRKIRFLIAIAASLFCGNAIACTTWATLGGINQAGGLLLTKNRDAPLDEVQKLQIVTPVKGYRYLALNYKHHPSDAKYQYTSAGINEKGVTVVNNASDAKTQNRDENETAVMTDILRNYASVAAVVKDQQKLFTKSQVNYLLIGDRKEVALVEIAPDGKYAIRTMTNGIFWHTNFYVDPDLVQYNEGETINSVDRYHRIDYLLHHHHGKFTRQANEAFAVDHVEGDDNSILRKYTVASWFVKIPGKGAPELFVKLFNPNQAKASAFLILNQKFWQHRNYDYTTKK